MWISGLNVITALITQRSQVQILPPLPRLRGRFRTRNRPLNCCLCMVSRTGRPPTRPPATQPGLLGMGSKHEESVHRDRCRCSARSGLVRSLGGGPGNSGGPQRASRQGLRCRPALSRRHLSWWLASVGGGPACVAVVLPVRSKAAGVIDGNWHAGGCGAPPRGR